MFIYVYFCTDTFILKPNQNIYKNCIWTRISDVTRKRHLLIETLEKNGPVYLDEGKKPRPKSLTKDREEPYSNRGMITVCKNKVKKFITFVTESLLLSSLFNLKENGFWSVCHISPSSDTSGTLLHEKKKKIVQYKPCTPS